MRARLRLATVTLLTPLCALAACSSSSGGGSTSSGGTSVTCGDGTELRGSQCVASLPDATTFDVAPPEDAGPSGPAFDGVSAVAPVSTTSLLVTWGDAKDPVTPPSRMKYAVYLATSQGGIDYGKPLATTAPGASLYYAEGLAAGTYYVAVRAIDEAGETDQNTNVKSGSPAIDRVTPAFSGVKHVAPGAPGAVDVSWDAATDDLTPSEAIVYVVYAWPITAPRDLGEPRAITRPGATSVSVGGLYDPNAVYAFEVHARDAAENLDANTATLSSRAGVDAEPPSFAGCTSARATSAGSAVVSWPPAVDDVTPADQIAYDVFVAPKQGAQDFKAAPALMVKGTTSATLFGLPSQTTLYFVCRARDASGNEDQNAIERIATTLADDTPPTFAGLTGVNVDSLARTVSITWDPALDDKTPPDQIVYDVYQSKTPGGEDFAGAPLVGSDRGATSIVVSDLVSDSTLYWVVRARDLAGNHDNNHVEASGQTDVSFEHDIQAIFNHDCAVVGCHVPGNPMANLILAPGFAYSYLVSQKATESQTLKRVNPGDPTTSYMYLKITMNPPPVGWQMPAPATGSVLTPTEKDLVRRWILQGAANN
jgi:hypothetical protein